ncbi:uncharacterized protein [Diabrotica undecimpunctata]|uniref:uncharacterized protein n=1 Tax=Diabrotica undecimpunctata TaxID=50387 RepID=UPI003B639D7C
MANKENMTRELRVLQTNVGTARLAHDLAETAAVEKNIDVLVTAEPNPTAVKRRGWFVDTTGRAAVRIYNRKLRVYEIKPKEGYVIVRMEGVRLVCCYISPNVTVGEYEMKIDEIMQEVGNTGGEYVVLGDFNAKAADWGSPITDARGRILTDWVGALDLVVLNTGLEPTFVRRGTGTYIDVTMATQEIAAKAVGWKVLPDYTGTEHQYIEFSITGKGTTNTVRASGTSMGRCGDGNDWKAGKSCTAQALSLNEYIERCYEKDELLE